MDFRQTFLCILFSNLIWVCVPVDGAFAQGSLQLVFTPRTGRSSDQHPLTANLSQLWCQAVNTVKGGDVERVPIVKANFLHFDPNKAFEGRIEDDRAFLNLSFRDLNAAGKYRCELTTANNEFVHGNMFVYMRPVFHTNGSMRLDVLDEERKFELLGSSSKAVRGTTAVLLCPVRGYPPPEIQWLKDGTPLDFSEKYSFMRHELHIRDVGDEDEGMYRCIATNKYPPAPDYKEAQYEAILDQQLRVVSSLSWLVPLFLIIVILILLVVIIYTCSWWKRRASHRYNVAEREKNHLDGAEAQRLHDTADDEE